MTQTTYSTHESATPQHNRFYELWYLLFMFVAPASTRRRASGTGCGQV